VQKGNSPSYLDNLVQLVRPARTMNPWSVCLLDYTGCRIKYVATPISPICPYYLSQFSQQSFGISKRNFMHAQSSYINIISFIHSFFHSFICSES